MSEMLYGDIGLNKVCDPNKWVDHLRLTDLPVKTATYNAALVQAFFPENYILDGTLAEYKVRVKLESRPKGGSWTLNTSAEFYMRASEAVAPPLILTAKIDLKATKTDVQVSFFLVASGETKIKLVHGQGTKSAPWTSGSMTALLVRVISPS